MTDNFTLPLATPGAPPCPCRNSTLTPVREHPGAIRTAPSGDILPDPPYITPEGNTYRFEYRVRLSDLYTVNGVR